MFKKILVGVDGSDSALKAVAVAASLCKDWDAQLVLVHVVQVSPVAVVVAVINMLISSMKNSFSQKFLILLLGITCFSNVSALVLPEDRADVRRLLCPPERSKRACQ